MTPERRASPGRVGGVSEGERRRESWDGSANGGGAARRDSFDGALRQSISRSAGGGGTPRRPSLGSSGNGAKRSVVKGDKVMEVWENQRWSRKRRGWVPSREWERPHWSTKQGEARPPPEETEPPPDYGWISNWRVDRGAEEGGVDAGTRDREGWEYATAWEKLTGERRPRGQEKWSDRARRRRWVRVMRPKVQLADARAAAELKEQVQQGLQGMVKGRLMLQNLVDMIGTRKDSSEMRTKLFAVIDLVKQHGREVEELLEAIDREVLPETKKLGNDLYKEQRQFEELAAKATERCRSTPPRLPDPPVTSSSAAADGSTSGGGGRTTAVPPLTTPQSSSVAEEVDTSGRASFSSGRTSFRPTTMTTPGGGGGAAGGGAAGALVMSTEDGNYVTREAQDEYIFSQMRVVDGDVFMEGVVREREEAIREVAKGITELKAMFVDFAMLVKEQQVGIDEIEKNVETAHARVEQGMQSIMYADKMHRESTCHVS